ncbi:TPA: polyphosphate kinase [Yersinia enterocolitica]
MLSKELEFTRKPDGGLADQIEALEAFAKGDADNTELLMLLIELRSLREQLAELKALKALEPVAWILNHGDGSSHIEKDKRVADMFEIFAGKKTMPLFTAAKPAEIPRHIFSMLVNELRDVPVIGCKRELIISVLNRHGVIAEPVQLDPPATE